ncbi:hypothetical protein AB0I22_06180 [Streptomyces sp. NPDC050610]|uniref:hypothetical protein n=1 Tax=Streptomyces sp. NPDC050610 TaxID=3157097 RepID=UPI0034391FF7
MTTRKHSVPRTDYKDTVVDAVIRAGGAWRIAPAWWLPASEYRTDRAVLARVRTELGRMMWVFS